MTKWLASVQSLAEAQMLLPTLPDILDMKNPAQGALGAMQLADIKAVVDLVDNRCVTSATIGDLEMKPGLIAERILAVANTGVDYVKIGVFPDKNLNECIGRLALTLSNNPIKVIAVLFADNYPEQEVIDALHHAGFVGIMVDTAFKNGKTLVDHWSREQLDNFVKQVKQHDLLCGLAGSLKIEHIAKLKKTNTDYLGFRSALCEKADRNSTLSLELAREVSRQFNL